MSFDDTTKHPTFRTNYMTHAALVSTATNFPSSTTPKSAGFAQADTLTILTSAGPMFTKVWDNPAEKPRGYDKVKQVQVRGVQVTDLHSLSALLTKLESKPKSCIIRGKFVGHEEAAKKYPAILAADSLQGKPLAPPKEGYTFRRKELFASQALHYFFIDIDNYTPIGIDPVLFPVAAINQYIATTLPGCFADISYHWQLSGSAGHESNAGVLKAHVSFWLTEAQTGEDLTLWAESQAKALDITVLRPVQPNYTAAPVFMNGVTDPVPVRSGLFEGHLGDSVDLHIDPPLLASARAAQVPRSALVDPRDKPGLIGQFCRTFDIETVVERWLSDVFAFDTEWRVTVLNSASQGVGGAGVTATRQGIFNTHAGDPFKGSPANKWDLVRHYKFGHLDADLSKADKILLGIGSWPSNLAMTDMVNALPEMQEAKVAVPAKATETHRAAIDSAASEEGLREIAQRISLDSSLDRLAKDMLAAALRNRFGALDGVKPSIAAVRGLMGIGLRRSPGNEAIENGPDWIQDWVYVTSRAKFFNQVTKEVITREAFDASFCRHMPADENGNAPSAAKVACDMWKLPTVYNLMYLPSAGPLFSVDGSEYANLYKAQSAPVGVYDQEVSDILAQHIALIIPREEYRVLFLQWCSWVVQNPGLKVLWAVFIKGIEGDGKSVIGSMLAQAMGHENVGIISPETLAGSAFNDWAVGRCVNVVEEMKMQGHNRHDVYNKIKPLITNPRIEVHGKGVASTTAINTVNYIGFSNHTDALPLNETDRRQFVLFTPYGKISAQNQVIESLGLTVDDYWDRLWDVVKNRPDAVRGFFESIDLTGFRPFNRAPNTDFKKMVVGLDKSDAEVQAEYLLSVGVAGVSRDVVSSACLTNALALLNPPLSLFTKQVSALLMSKGFVPHSKQLIKWKGTPHRVWVKEENAQADTAVVRDLLDRSVELAEANPAQDAAARDFNIGG